MASINNLQNNITFILTPTNIVEINYDEDFKNWIGFEMQLTTPSETIAYSASAHMMLSVSEIKGYLHKIQMLLSGHTEQAEYYSVERYFDLKINSLPEEDKYEAVLWINMGSYTNGKGYGYDKGYKFYVSKKTIHDFRINLIEELKEIINDF